MRSWVVVDAVRGAARRVVDGAKSAKGVLYVGLTFWAYELGARAARERQERARREVLDGCTPDGGHRDGCACGRLDGETFIALALAFVIAGATVLSGCSAPVAPPSIDGGAVDVDAAAGCKIGLIECPEGTTCNVAHDVCEAIPSGHCWNTDAGAWVVCP